MPSRRVLVLGLALLAPRLALSQPASGPYVSLGIGADFLQDQTFHASGGSVPAPRGVRFDAGPAGYVSLGYSLPRGLRLELEGNGSDSHVRGAISAAPLRAGGYEQQYGGFLNAYQDFSAPFGLTPYLGLGAGYQAAGLDNFDATAPHAPQAAGSRMQGSFAYQGIAGISAPIGLPGVDVTAEYRMIGLITPPDSPRDADGEMVHTTVGNTFNHELLIGLRLLFGGPRPQTPDPAAQAASVPAPAPARTYLVFFDWDGSDLTARAREVIAEAAQASQRIQTTRIEVDGYTDLSGTPLYNKALSLRRADVVAAELVRDGVSRAEIVIEGFGEAHPLVPTGKGAREAQNRRVEIILKI